MLDTFGRLALKNNVSVDVSNARVVLIDTIEFPREMFSVSQGDYGETMLKVNAPWQITAALRIPRGSNSFHYCISGGDAESFIPTAFFLGLQPQK